MKKILVSLVVMAVFGAASCTTANEATTKEVRRKAAVLIVPGQVQDPEINEISSALNGIGFTVTLASVDGKEITGIEGGTYMPDTTVDTIVEADYDVIVGIGGYGVFDILENATIISLFQDFYAAGKYTTAICGSSAILANAGLLEGKQATTFPYEPLIKALTDNGAKYIDTEVAIAGKIITGNGPGASVAFANALVEALK